eukprot:CAMPEP_0118650648 /NCGR_PEP_ID=MMETSP0785-20121206/10357_1 /TAXON_ID=91992 /ORGANISM="Bolidomonas pacifica, Strain CCMP 1866" /LENGTH=61 /DNA_ID=CAMNT_0006543033 /DNA_START=772 /DNA_END=957 /DNA_ORIENTATION=+
MVTTFTPTVHKRVNRNRHKTVTYQAVRKHVRTAQPAYIDNPAHRNLNQRYDEDPGVYVGTV